MKEKTKESESGDLMSNEAVTQEEPKSHLTHPTEVEPILSRQNRTMIHSLERLIERLKTGEAASMRLVRRPEGAPGAAVLVRFDGGAGIQAEMESFFAIREGLY